MASRDPEEALERRLRAVDQELAAIVGGCDRRYYRIAARRLALCAALVALRMRQDFCAMAWSLGATKPTVIALGCGEDAYERPLPEKAAAREPLRRLRERGLRVCEQIEAAWPIESAARVPAFDAYLRGMKRWSAILRCLHALESGTEFAACGVLNTPAVIALDYDAGWLTENTRQARFGSDPGMIPQRLRPKAGKPPPKKPRTLLSRLVGDFCGPEGIFGNQNLTQNP